MDASTHRMSSQNPAPWYFKELSRGTGVANVAVASRPFARRSSVPARAHPQSAFARPASARSSLYSRPLARLADDSSGGKRSKRQGSGLITHDEVSALTRSVAVLPPLFAQYS